MKPQLNRYFEILKETPLKDGGVQWEARNFTRRPQAKSAFTKRV
jgi:hypothetical protein